MKFGIFSKEINKGNLIETFNEISKYGMKYTQFNFANVGLQNPPDFVSQDILDLIKHASAKSGVSIPVVSGTFNTLEMDEIKHKENMERFKLLCENAYKLDIPYISISTGSYDQENFWHAHPDNHTEKAWNQLYGVLDNMIEYAKEWNRVIVVEPEQANVVSTIDDTLRLMDHYQTDALRVLFDPANIVTYADKNNPLTKINSALDELKDFIAIAHCKDCRFEGGEVKFVSVGKGDLPLREYVKSLKRVYSGPIIMHGVKEEDIGSALIYLKGDN